MLTPSRVLFAGVLVAGLCRPTSAVSDDSKVLPNVKAAADAVVYRGTYPGWPWIARTPSGRLVCVWREGTEHMYSATGNLMLAESTDEGGTWSQPQIILDEPEIDERNVAILPLSDNDWLVCYNTYTRQGKSRTMTMRSKDGGRTWLQPRLVCDLEARTRSAPIKLTSGDLVLPFYTEPPMQSLAAWSNDDGNTWNIARIDNSPDFVGNEWDVCELPDRRLIGIVRNDAPKNGGWFYKTESRDGGRTWDKAVKTNLRSTRHTSPAQIFLHRNRPVVLYSDERFISVSMAITDDPKMETWKVDERLPCYRYRTDGQRIADGSYPVSAAAGGNKRFVVDYVHDGNDHEIRGYSVDLPSSWSKPEPN